ncbi:MAG: response regulator, partial [Oceanospirillaceae bacterium]|nr:response regulator [Oceanospirillaceae bacterium]
MREKQALTTGEVAKYCGVNFRTVIRWIERGHLDAYKLPGRGDNRIPVSSFITFLQDNNMPVPGDLSLGVRTLVLLADAEDFSADVASFVRRAGWE